MRYRLRKEEAGRKLDHTEKNSKRIEDILEELGDRSARSRAERVRAGVS
jgi:chromosome segregation ATPase